MWREASETLANEGLLDTTLQGGKRRHPLIKVIADVASDMVRFSGEFGLTPVARTRIAQGHRQEPSKFDGLLAGLQDE
jgi:P27 family predicted phage terminase small subunit